LRGLPLREEFVDCGLAIEIKPEKHGACVPVGLPEGAIGEKQSAILPGDASNAALAVSPIEGEAKRVAVVGCGFVDVSRGDLRDRCGERRSVVGASLYRVEQWVNSRVVDITNLELVFGRELSPSDR
jgi:hypothetical protein